MLLEEALENYISSIGGTLHDGTPILKTKFISTDKWNSSRVCSKGKWKEKPSISNYGEADLKLEVWSERAIHDEGGLLLTIDSDSVAIALLNNVHATIELSKIWKSKKDSNTIPLFQLNEHNVLLNTLSLYMFTI